MSQEITSYSTYGAHNEKKGEYVGMSDAGWQVYDALTDPDKILLRDGLKMLMKQVFEDKKIDLPAINNMRSRSTQNNQYIYIYIESIKKQAGRTHDFIGKLTIGDHIYFIKLMCQWGKYTPYNEHKAQDIAKQLLGGERFFVITQSKIIKIIQKLKNYIGYNDESDKAYIRIANPLYSFIKKGTDSSYNGFIVYPFEENIKLLGNDSKLRDTYYEMIIDTLGLRQGPIQETHERNISYKYDDNGSLIFTVFDLGLWDAIDKIHNLYPHAPRPPKPPRRTNT